MRGVLSQRLIVISAILSKPARGFEPEFKQISNRLMRAKRERSAPRYPYMARRRIQCSGLHSKRLVALITLCTVLALAFVPFISAQQGSSPQYAAYAISLSGRGHSSSFVLNESVASAPGNQAALMLQVISANRNLSYSRVVNLTQEMLLPILPSISNQSLNYQTNNYSVTINLARAGVATASFSGASYTTTKFTFQVSVKSGGMNLPAAGNLTTFPSGLIYSASALVNGTVSLQASLFRTNLPLDPPGQSSSTTTTIAVAGGLGTAAVIGALALVRRGKKNGPNSPSSNAKDGKPSHWVD